MTYLKHQYKNPLQFQEQCSYKLPEDNIVQKNYKLIITDPIIKNSKECSTRNFTFYCTYCNRSANSLSELERLCENTFQSYKNSNLISKPLLPHQIKSIHNCKAVRSYIQLNKQKYLEIINRHSHFPDVGNTSL